MKISLTIDHDFSNLSKALPKLMVKRINDDISIVQKQIEKGLKTSKSPVTGRKFAPISNVTEKVRKIRRQTRKSKNKPLVATGRMGRLKIKKATKQGKLAFYGFIQMGADYGQYHLQEQTIKTNFSAVGRARTKTQTIPGGLIKTHNRKQTFFNVKGKKVPARIWFGIPKDYTGKKSFRSFMASMKRKLKEGDIIIKKPIGSISLG
tara:strand:- start:1812 stop:2429 length:618 start_codon:yes stop_codon:yes gene_type:complete